MKGIIKAGDPDWWDHTHTVTVELTERNLKTLLFKLERTDSARTLMIDDDKGNQYYVKAVPDSEHYNERQPGEVHPKEASRLE